jgi:glycerol-3-phosphate dehydrogenase
MLDEKLGAKDGSASSNCPWPLRFGMPHEAPGALGSGVAPGLFEAELKVPHTHEWTCTAEDVPSRRTKRTLHRNAAERAAVARGCAAHWPWARADAGALPIEEKAWS